MKSKGLPIVVVQWVDAHTNSEGWISRSEYEAWLDFPCVMTSVGMLMEKTSKWVVLAMSIGDDSVADCLKIPTGMVQKMTRIGYSEVNKRKVKAKR